MYRRFQANLPTRSAIGVPETNLQPPRLDFGSRFETERVADKVPPLLGQPFVTLVPRPDEDGLDQGGIALPELQVSLGTYTGFNTRTEAAGFPWATSRWDGSLVPFPRTEAERRACGEFTALAGGAVRAHGDYVGKVNGAATAAATRRFPLSEEVDALIREAGELYDRVTTHDPADPAVRTCSAIRLKSVVCSFRAKIWSKIGIRRSRRDWCDGRGHLAA